MSFDQLGLFCNNKTEQYEGYKAGMTKLSLTVNSAVVSSKKMHEVAQKITQEVRDLDSAALVMTDISNDKNQAWQDQPFLAIDVETTGLDAASNRVIELALVPFNMPDEPKPLSQLFSVSEPLPQEIINITGINDDMLKGMPPFNECIDEMVRLIKKANFVVAYNAKFDRPFLESEMARFEQVLPDIPWVDPFIFICELDRYKKGKKLSDAARRWGVNLENAHRALADASAAGKLMLKLADAISCHGLGELLAKQKIWQWRNAHAMAELKRTSTWSINR